MYGGGSKYYTNDNTIKFLSGYRVKVGFWFNMILSLTRKALKIFELNLFSIRSNANEISQMT